MQALRVAFANSTYVFVEELPVARVEVRGASARFSIELAVAEDE
jgi:hypothetical protein